MVKLLMLYGLSTQVSKNFQNMYRYPICALHKLFINIHLAITTNDLNKHICVVLRKYVEMTSRDQSSQAVG